MKSWRTSRAEAVQPGGESIAVGIVGLGRSGWNLHAEALRRHPRYEIVAVCDPDSNRLSQAKSELSVTGFGEFHSFLKEAAPDLVIIASPTPLHARMACDALAAGRHVVLEKPLATTVEEAEPLGEQAKESGRLLSPYYNYRFATDFVAVRAVLDEGLIGRPFSIRRQVGSFNRRDDWQAHTDRGGDGILGAATIHFMDQVLQLAVREPTEVWSEVSCVVARGDAADHSKVVLRFPNGLIGDIEVSWAEAIAGPEWLIHGSRGALSVEGEEMRVRWFVEEEVRAGLPRDRSYYADEEIEWHERRETVGGGFTTDYYDMVAEAIRGSGPVPVDWEDAMRTFRIVEACRQ